MQLMHSDNQYLAELVTVFSPLTTMLTAIIGGTHTSRSAHYGDNLTADASGTPISYTVGSGKCALVYLTSMDASGNANVNSGASLALTTIYTPLGGGGVNIARLSLSAAPDVVPQRTVITPMFIMNVGDKLESSYSLSGRTAGTFSFVVAQHIVEWSL